jgi:hypothetical protein
MKTLLALSAALVGAATLAAILAPTALAKSGVTLRTYAPPSLYAGSALPNPDYATQKVRPDDRAGRALVHVPRQVALLQSSNAGFDWSDAGVGAGAGAGLVLFLFGASLFVRRVRTEPRPA